MAMNDKTPEKMALLKKYQTSLFPLVNQKFGTEVTGWEDSNEVLDEWTSADFDQRKMDYNFSEEEKALILEF